MPITRNHRLIALVAVLAVGIVLSTAVTSADPSGEATQIFHSGDKDAENATAYENTHGVDFSNLEPGSDEYYEHIANVSDITFKTTAPDQSFNGTSLLKYRRLQTSALATNDDGKIRGNNNPKEGVIEGARVDIVGVHGGARPRFETGLLDWSGPNGPLHVGRSGKVLLSSDHEVEMYNDSDCHLPANSTEGEIEYCYDYDKKSTDEDIKVMIGDETEQAKGSPAVIDFDGVSAGKTSIRVEYNVTVEYEVTREKHVYENGSWEERYDAEREWYRSDWVIATDQIDPVQVSDGETLEVGIKQTVINVSEDRKRVIVHFPETSKNPTMADARGRLWSEIEFNRTVIRGPWRMYSKVDKSFGDPNVLRQYLVAVGHRPRVTSKTVGDEKLGGFSRARLITWSGSNLSTPTAAHGNVQVSATTPQLYDRIVVDRVEKPASTIRTIHGRTIDIGDDVQTVQYRTPEVTIESIPGPENRVRIRVTDPKTNTGIADYPVRLFGTVQQNMTTNRRGVVVADRQNMVVRVDFVGDDLRGLTEQPSTGTLYSDVRKTQVFMDAIDVMKRLYDLVFALVVVSPLILLYFYIRHFQFFD